MPTYEIYKKDGTPVRVEGPEGATTAQLVDLYARSKRSPAPEPTSIEERQASRRERLKRLGELSPSTFTDQVGEVSKGLLGGAANLFESGLVGAATLFPEEQELALRGGIQSLGGGIQDFLAPDANIGTGAGMISSNVPRKFSEALGSFAGILGTAAIPVVGLPLAGMLAVGAGAGEASERARETGATEEERTKAAQLGALVGATELAPIERVRRIIKALPDGAAKTFKGKLANVGLATSLEGAQEALASALQNKIEQGYNPEQELLEGVGEAGRYGGGVGGFVESLIQFVGPKVRGGATTTTPTPTDQIQDLDRPVQGPNPLGAVQGPAPLAPTQGPAPLAPTQEPEQYERIKILKNTEIDGVKVPKGVVVDVFSSQAKEQIEGGFAELQEDIPSPISYADLTKEQRRTLEAAPLNQKDALLATYAKQNEPQKAAVDLTKTAATTDTAMGEQISTQLAEKEKQEQQFKEAEAAVREAELTTAQTAISPESLKVKEDIKRDLVQPPLPGLAPTYGEKKRQARIDEREIETEPTATGTQFTEELISTMAGRDPNIITPELLNRLGVSPKAPIRKRVEGKDINTPEVRQQLVDLGNNPKVAQQTKFNISRYLADVSEGQGDLFAPQTRGKPDGGTDTTGSGVSVSGDRSGVAVPVKKEDSSPTEVTTPAAAGLGGLGAPVDGTDVGKGPEASALEFKKLSREQGRSFRRSLLDMFNLRKEKSRLEYERTGNFDLYDRTELRNPKTDTGVTIDVLNNPKDYYDALSEEQKSIYNAAPENEKGEVLAKLSIADVRKEPEPVAKKVVAKPEQEAKESTSDNIEQSKKEFAPTKTPQLVNRRDKKDLKETSRGNYAISGGSQEGRLTDPRDLKREFTKINYEAPIKGNILPFTLKNVYGDALNNIKITTGGTTYLGAHHNGGIVLKGDLPNVAPITPNIIAHELGHASHSLLGDQINKNTETQKELLAIENFLYPELRNKIETAVADGQELGDSSTEFFNYLLSPEELIAEFNVLRVISPQSANSVAPSLSSLLESVQSDPNLVVDRQTFPSGWGTIVIKAPEYFNGDYTKLNADIARATKKADLRKESKPVAKKVVAKPEPVAKKVVAKPEPSVFKTKEAEKVFDDLGSLEKNQYKPPSKEEKAKKTVAVIKEFGNKTRQTNEDAYVLYAEVAAINNIDTGAAKRLVTNAFAGIGIKLKLPTDVTLDLPVDGSVVAAAKKGNLKETLEAVANTTANANTELASFVRMLTRNIGSTTVEVRKNLKDDDGQLVSGYFDPETNSIVLDEKNGMSQHTILHEMLHAVTSTPLANKSHPLTKKLNGIFEGVKEQLSGEYGLNSLDEFVAEYRTNPRFRTQLKITTVNGRNSWQQLTRAIANYIRTLFKRPTVPETSTFDAVDKLVQDLISPNYDERVATKLYMKIKTPAGAKEVLDNAAANAVNYVKGKSGYDYIQDSRNFMGSKIPLPAKKLWLNLQPVNILAELSESRIPGALQLNTLINNMSSTLRKKNESLDPIVADIKAFRKKKPELYTILQSLVPNATYERIDPREANFEKAYGHSKKSDRYDPEEARKIHKELRKDYGKLGKEGQDLYNVITFTFEKSLFDVMDAVEANLSATVTGAAGQKRAKDKLAELLNQERGRIKPFAPLTRAGKHRLKYVAIDPKTGKIEVFVEYFKTKGQREKAKRNLQEYNKSSLAKLPPNDPRRAEVSSALMEEGTSTDLINYNDAPKGSFVFKVLEILRAEGADETTINSVVDLALDSMPERSFMQSFRTRKDVRGFLGDATPTGMAAEAFDLLDMVETKGRDYNRQLVQMQFGAKIQKFQQEVLEAPFPRETTDETTTLYRDRLNLISNFAKKPDIPRWSQSLNATGYAWTMGLNFSSAAITTFDVFMSSAPRMAGRYGDGATAKAMGSAAAILFRSPKTKMVEVMGPDGNMTGRKINTGLAGFSIGNYDYEMLKNMTAQEITTAGMTKEQHKNLLDLEVMAEVAKENAQINQSLNQEELDMNNAKDVLEKINSYSSFLFHHSERYNRETAMTANYLLELNRLRSDKATPAEKKLTDLEKQQTAAATSIKETEFTLGATASAGRPVLAQSAVGNVFMLFKRFAISKYHMMATMTNESFQAGGDSQTQENRRIAQHQLGRFLISTGLFAGVAGLPLIGALGQLYDLFADDDEDDFDAMLRKNVGEGFYKGIINEALGIELSSRISMNSLLYRPPIINKDQSELWTLIEQFGGPIVGIYLSAERGVNLMGEGEILRGTQAIAPASLRNIMKSVEQGYTGEAKITRRGDAVVEDLGVFQTIAQFGGFSNADLIRQYDINKNERRKSGYLSETRTSLLQEANIAITNGDFKGYSKVLKKIQEYNKNLPLTARKEKLILPKTMDRSRKSFDARTAKTIGGIKYDAMMIESLNEYDQGMRLFS